MDYSVSKYILSSYTGPGAAKSEARVQPWCQPRAMWCWVRREHVQRQCLSGFEAWTINLTSHGWQRMRLGSGPPSPKEPQLIGIPVSPKERKGNSGIALCMLLGSTADFTGLSYVPVCFKTRSNQLGLELSIVSRVTQRTSHALRPTCNPVCPRTRGSRCLWKPIEVEPQNYNTAESLKQR